MRKRFTRTFVNRLLDATLPLPERDWDADWRVRLPASAVLLASRAMLAAPHRAGDAGPRDAIVATYHLGDQIRMLNVLSRFAVDAPALFTNAEAAPVAALFDCVTVDGILPYHGVLSAVAKAPHERFRRALLPHPSMTQAATLAFARRIAATVDAVSLEEYAYRARGVRFFAADRQSWRTFYESFFRNALGASPVTDRPRLRDGVCHVGMASADIVAHLGASVAERSMPPSVAAQIVAEIARLGYRPVLVGATAESAALEALARGTPAIVRAGLAIPEIARVMAGARAFVGVESSMMNLSDAVGTPSVIVYSAGSQAVQGPYYTRTESVAAAEPTVSRVTSLTGRLARPSNAWDRVAQRTGEALTRLLA